MKTVIYEGPDEALQYKRVTLHRGTPTDLPDEDADALLKRGDVKADGGKRSRGKAKDADDAGDSPASGDEE